MVSGETGAQLNAESNWWGAAKRPSGAGGGGGDTVRHECSFTPYLLTRPSFCPEPSPARQDPDGESNRDGHTDVHPRQ